MLSPEFRERELAQRSSYRSDDVSSEHFEFLQKSRGKTQYHVALLAFFFPLIIFPALGEP